MAILLHRIEGKRPLGVEGIVADISIRGGKPLNGCVCIHGSKNAALPMMAASFLHKGISVLKGCPAIADVFCMEEILRQLGAVTWWEEQDLYMDCTHAEKSEIGKEYTGRMRSSVILLGVLLARCREGKLGYPGGCVIGKRPVDYHLAVLRSLGAELTEQEDGIMAKAGTLVGSEIQIPRRSVGATEQGILASVLAKRRERFQKLRQRAGNPVALPVSAGMGAKIAGKAPTASAFAV